MEFKDSIITQLSHNTMGAFFSGTDDRDDRCGIWYSGVFGRLNDPNPSTVWRMNINHWNEKCNVDDIFDVPKIEARSTSEDWLKKVNVGFQGYSSNLNRGHSQANQGLRTVGGRSSQSDKPHMRRDSRTGSWIDSGNSGKALTHSSNDQKNGVGRLADQFGDDSSSWNSDRFSDNHLGASAAEREALGLDEDDEDYYGNWGVPYDPKLHGSEQDYVQALPLPEEFEEDNESGLYLPSALTGSKESLEEVVEDDVEDIIAQMEIWFEGLDNNPNGQLEALRTLYEKSDNKVKDDLATHGF